MPAGPRLLAHLLGGFEAAGLIHRFCAVLTFTYFGLHLYDLMKQRRASGKSWRRVHHRRREHAVQPARLAAS